MKTSKRTIMIIAAVLMIAGAVISSSVFVFSDFKLSDMSNVKYETNTYTITENFDNISVASGDFDINFYPSENKICTVVCKESDKIHHSVKVDNNTLTINELEVAWFERINFMTIEKFEINIYLPELEYETLDISCSSGNVTVPDKFIFNKNANITVSSGDVSFDGYVKNNLEISATSGDIKLTDVKAEDITLSVTSGDIRCVKTQAFNRLHTTATSGDITIKDSGMDYLWNGTTSGDTDLINSTAFYDIYMESTSGEIELDRCDADTFEINTTSGDITGTLLTEKIFITDTNSGDIDVPESDKGGKFKIRTTSGDAEIEICK